MFSLVHGRANFIPQARNIDHVNVWAVLFSSLFLGFKKAQSMYLYVRGEILEKCIYYKISEQYNLRKCECAPKLQLKFFIQLCIL